MDGLYQNKMPQIKAFLSNWIANTVIDNKWDVVPDLHIDEILPEFKKNQTWIDGSLIIYKLLLELLDLKKYDAMLVIPLAYAKNKFDSQIDSIIDLKSNLYITPPSFYFLPVESDSFKLSLEGAVYATKLSNEIGLPAFYKIEKEDNEYYRTLYISHSK